MKTSCVAFVMIVGAFTTVHAQQNKTKPTNLMERAQLTCKLTTPELQQRKRTVIAELKGLVKERNETTNSVRYKFESSDKNIDLVLSFMKTERLCCDFFEFQLELNSGSDFMWLELSGPDGVKDFIREEIGF